MDKNPTFQLNVTLRCIHPPIWRRVHVRGDTTLDSLRVVLQASMGWTNRHLQEFILSGTSYRPAGPELEELKGEDESTVSVSTIAPTKGARFGYLYDFGDSWEHDIVVEQVLEADEPLRSPVCIAGKRACAPEDCGGIPGYEEFQEAIGDPQHPEHGEMIEWIGEGFDPEHFDVDAANAVMRRFR